MAFEINVHIHSHGSSNQDGLMAKLDQILLAIHQMKGTVMSAIDDLQTAVEAENTVIDSAITLLQGLKAALDAAGTDPTKLAALSAEISAKTTALSDAVVANTPAAPAPPPAP